LNAPFDSIGNAFAVLADPGNPRWTEVFGFLAMEPETGQIMIEAFRKSPEGMGTEPTGTDPVKSGPAHALVDIARAMGVPAEDLDRAMAATQPGDVPGHS
jgi:hypothetical protein